MIVIGEMFHTGFCECIQFGLERLTEHVSFSEYHMEVANMTLQVNTSVAVPDAVSGASGKKVRNNSSYKDTVHISTAHKTSLSTSKTWTTRSDFGTGCKCCLSLYRVKGQLSGYLTVLHPGYFC